MKLNVIYIVILKYCWLIADLIVNTCMYLYCGLYNFTLKKRMNFIWFGCSKLKSSMIIWILFKICVWQKVVVIAEVIVNACMYFCCGLYNFTQRKQTSFFWFGCNKMKSSMIIWIFFSRWELSEEEESGGSDVETLVNQKQTAVSETLHKTPGCCNKCTQALYM